MYGSPVESGMTHRWREIVEDVCAAEVDHGDEDAR
jgi:hypothetical protein